MVLIVYNDNLFIVFVYIIIVFPYSISNDWIFKNLFSTLAHIQNPYKILCFDKIFTILMKYIQYYIYSRLELLRKPSYHCQEGTTLA